MTAYLEELKSLLEDVTDASGCECPACGGFVVGATRAMIVLASAEPEELAMLHANVVEIFGELAEGLGRGRVH